MKETTLFITTEEDIAQIPSQGACVVVCNHPYGNQDYTIARDVIAKVRTDIKLFDGSQLCAEHLALGGVLIVFPAGDYSREHGPHKDPLWQESVMEFIRSCAPGILPLYLHDAQDPSQCPEVPVQVVVGKAIDQNEYAAMSPRVMADWLRERTYVLEAQIQDKRTIKPIQGVPIDPHQSREDLLAEMQANSADFLYSVDRFAVYFSPYEHIPCMIKELGVCREETFRAVGEGTGTACDLDKYDTYYEHLYIWDTVENELVGAYRLGMGNKIMASCGIHGFYSDIFFRYDSSMADVLGQTLELGRSFVNCIYQKNPLALMLLIKGIFVVLLNKPEIKYMCGPVTTSGAYPHFYKSLMLEFLKKNYSCEPFADKVSPILPFIPDYGRVDVQKLYAGNQPQTIEQFDRFMMKISGGKYRMPTLVKKYFKLGVRVLDCNVDKDFNFCVDSLIFVKLSDCNKDDVEQLTKDVCTPQYAFERFGICTD